jgi:hypothetical protein
MFGLVASSVEHLGSAVRTMPARNHHILREGEHPSASRTVQAGILEK